MYSYFVGIDIAKNTHWASCISSNGEIIFEPFSFSNDNNGFQKFISKLDSLDKTKILIGLESTAHYGENIISFLFNLNFNIGLINPIQTATLRRTNIRKTKNDKVDTKIIIKAFRQPSALRCVNGDFPQALLCLAISAFCLPP